MTALKISSVVLIGAGNLAFHLAFVLARSGVRILQIVNRTPHKGIKLAEEHRAHTPQTWKILTELQTCTYWL
jgi:glutamyl-tRNA reductase